MRVNKAITRLANKKQMETDNLYMLFVFWVLRTQRTIFYKILQPIFRPVQ